MEVTKTSIFSGNINTREVDIDETTLKKFNKGKLTAFQAFGHLEESDYRFLETGITPEEWEEAIEEGYTRHYQKASLAFWAYYTAMIVVTICLCYIYVWS